MEKYIKPRGSMMEERLRMADLDERIDEGVLRWRGWREIGLSRESTKESVG